MLDHKVAVFGPCLALAIATGCDPQPSPDVSLRSERIAAPLAQPLANLATIQEELKAVLPGADIEVFRFGYEDVFALNVAPSPLFAPIPADIEVFTEPLLANAFMLAFRLYDGAGELVGYGTEQEVVDFASATTKTSYTLTVPETGTLMLAQREDFSVPLAEVNDMLEKNELIRTYEPPMVFISTIPKTGRVIGGTDEYAGARGAAVEITILREIDLIERVLDIEEVLVVALVFP